MDQILKVYNSDGEEIEMSLDALAKAIVAGNVSSDTLAQLKKILRPKSETSILKEKAQASLDAFLDTPISDVFGNEEGVVSPDILIRDIFKDIQELEGEVKKHGGTRVKHSTQVLKWASKADVIVELYSGDYVDCSKKEMDGVNKVRILEDGYTVGQWNAVTKFRRSLSN